MRLQIATHPRLASGLVRRQYHEPKGSPIGDAARVVGEEDGLERPGHPLRSPNTLRISALACSSMSAGSSPARRSATSRLRFGLVEKRYSPPSTRR